MCVVRLCAIVFLAVLFDSAFVGNAERPDRERSHRKSKTFKKRKEAKVDQSRIYDVVRSANRHKALATAPCDRCPTGCIVQGACHLRDPAGNPATQYKCLQYSGKWCPEVATQQAQDGLDDEVAIHPDEEDNHFSSGNFSDGSRSDDDDGESNVEGAGKADEAEPCIEASQDECESWRMYGCRWQDTTEEESGGWCYHKNSKQYHDQMPNIAQIKAKEMRLAHPAKADIKVAPLAAKAGVSRPPVDNEDVNLDESDRLPVQHVLGWTARAFDEGAAEFRRTAAETHKRKGTALKHGPDF